jgi:hypothetical protein
MNHISQYLSCINRYFKGRDKRVVFFAQVLNAFASYQVLDGYDQKLDQTSYGVAFPLKPINLTVRHAG